MATDQHSTIRSAIDEGRLRVPVLPEAASQVLALAGSPDCEARDLVEVIKRDQALMAHLLKVANSAMLAPEIPIVSLQLAVGRLGLARVRDIALAAALKAEVFRPGRHAALVRGYFRRALATAFYSQEIARQRRRNVELAFLAGLLRDVAAPAICALVGDDEPSDLGLDVLVDEFAPEASARMIESWRLPPVIAAVARRDRGSEEGGDQADLCASVALAAALAAEVLGAEGDEMGLAQAAVLNLYQDDVELLRGRGDHVLELVETCA
ncbi:MAG: HDOD domain-containing protein [Planctomycetes bacterium]|nr:HDOD domain-containing protein [Planctomycetota bacterium]